MRKILFTGPSGISCGLGNLLGIISNTTSIIDAYFSYLDYAVERRPVIPGENLDEYDKVFVTQQSIASFVAPFAHGMAWALYSRPDAYICIDDWQGPDAFGVGKVESMIDCLWKESLGRKYREKALDVKIKLDIAISELCSKNERVYLLPVVEGGNINKINCNGVRRGYDPSPLMEKYEYTEKGMKYYKRKRWVLAALQDNTNWLHRNGFDRTEWEILQYGVKKFGQQRLTEAQLARVYASSWGVLSPLHKKLHGTGWWRVRYKMAAEAGSILVSERGDLSFINKCFDAQFKEIEEMTDYELGAFAELQKKELFNKLWSIDKLVNFVEKL